MAKKRELREYRVEKGTPTGYGDYTWRDVGTYDATSRTGAIAQAKKDGYKGRLVAHVGNRVRLNPSRSNPARKRVSMAWYIYHDGTISKSYPTRFAAEKAARAWLKRHPGRTVDLKVTEGPHDYVRTVERLQNPARSNPKSVSLKNFTGTITKNKNGTVTVRGKGKRK